MACLMCEITENIKDDPYFVAELETGYVDIGWYQHFRGYTLFICKKHVTELHQLPHNMKMKFLEEMSLVAEAVYNVFKPEKMNYELLGNGVSHMHWHLFPRVSGDTHIKGPVWYLPKEEMYDENNRLNEKDLLEMTNMLKLEIERLLTIQHLK